MVNRWKRSVAQGLGLVGGLVLAAAAQAALLQVNPSGLLTGATGVVVDGASYDVEFRYGQSLAGTCVEAFGSCAVGQVFTFSTQSAARAASQALLDQVFTGTFDVNLKLTAGCDSASLFCVVGTPWQVFAMAGVKVSVELAYNSSQGADHLGLATLFAASDNLSSMGERGADYIWASWTPAATSTVPEPTLPALLGAAAAAAALTRRRRSTRR